MRNILDGLKALVAVIDANSVSKASPHLLLTQPAVTRRVQVLEEFLSIDLFDRAHRPPTPTAIGLEIYKHAVPILKAVDDLLFISNTKTDPPRKLRLGIATEICDLMLPEVVAKLQSTYSRLELRLSTNWSNKLQHDVAEGEMDAALVLLPATAHVPLAFKVYFIGSIRLAVVQERRHPRFTAPKRLKTLLGEKWVLNPLGCGFRTELEVAAAGLPHNLDVAVDAFGTDVQLRLVAWGLGLGLVPQAALCTSALRNDVSIVEVSDYSFSLNLWLVHSLELTYFNNVLETLASTVLARLEQSP